MLSVIPINFPLVDPGLWRHQFCSVALSCLTLRPHGLQHARFPCPSPIRGACSNSCPLSRWCHPTILSSVIPFSSCPQSLPASRSFPMSQFFVSGGQSIGVSASTSVLCLELCKTVDIKILPCSPETITALLIGCPPIQNKKFKTKTRF